MRDSSCKGRHTVCVSFHYISRGIFTSVCPIWTKSPSTQLFCHSKRKSQGNFFGNRLALNPRSRRAHLCQVPATTQTLITTVLDIHALCSTSCSRSISATSQKRLQSSQRRIHARISLFSMGVAEAACQADRARREVRLQKLIKYPGYFSK